MRTKFAFIVSSILMIGLFAGSVSAQIRLTFNNYFPPTHIASRLTDEWSKEIGKRTNGAVQVQHFAGGQLLGPDRVYEGVVQGIADMGYTNLAYTRGRFPEMEMCDLPLGMPSGWVSSRVAQEFYRKYQPKEFDDVKVIFFNASGPNLIGTTDKPVRTLEDLRGQTLRATGRIADTAQALGATPRPMAITETYEAVRRNVVSGVMLPFETYQAFRLGELLKYCTANWQVGNVFTFYAVMNKRKWDSLPDNIKKIFDEVNREFEDKLAEGWNQIDIGGVEFFKSRGGEIIHLSDAETERWNQAVAPVIENYLQETAKRGVATLEELKSRIEWIKKTRDEFSEMQIAKGIPMPVENR